MVLINTTMIKIFKSNQQFFIWNAEDAHILREKHRIVGTLVGCLPRNPLQNSHLGLPLLLMNCEVRLLVEKGIACIVDEADIKKVDNLAEKIAKQRETVYHEQVLLCRKGKRKEMEHNMKSVVEGKKRKINDIVSNIDQGQQDHGPTDITGLLAKELALEEQKIEEFTLPLESSVIQIHTARFPEESLESIPVSTSWCLQLSKEDLLRYYAFLHFWEQGYFLTCGTKFGGDFLVYPGDPSRFHSFYIVACYESDKEVNVMKLLRMSRLGNSVKKTFVIASVDFNNHNKVNCWSLLRAED